MISNKLVVFLALGASNLVVGLKNPCPSQYDQCEAPGYGKKSLKDKDYSCWSNVGGNWLCAKKGDDGSCPYGYNDVSYCGGGGGDYNPPYPPKRKCPPKGQWNTPCNSEFGGGSATFGNPGQLQCWKPIRNDAWACEKKNNGRCFMPYIDIVKECGSPPIDHNKCPEENALETPCSPVNGLGGGTFLNPGNFVCWRFNGNGFNCELALPGGGCLSNHYNIDKCPIKRPPPSCDDFTSPDDKCQITIGGGGEATFGRPGVNVCWSKRNNRVECRPYPPGGSGCGSNEIDVSTCPPKDNECPTDRKTKCKIIGQDGSASFERPGGNICWIKVGNDFFCAKPVNGSCRPGEKNIIKECKEKKEYY